MKEIEKLRRRLSNVARNVTEYRMTVDEARGLLKEIEQLELTVKQKPKEVYIAKEVEPLQADAPLQTARILDGGTF